MNRLDVEVGINAVVEYDVHYDDIAIRSVKMGDIDITDHLSEIDLDRFVELIELSQDNEKEYIEGDIKHDLARDE